jgi:peptidoglycan/xylan/chitin deacetylase (PgdA/CDA1 family)
VTPWRARIGILFHGIGEPPPDLHHHDQAYFVTQELFLSLLDEIMERPEVELSFDDGYASDIEIVLPALRKRGLKACFFPVAGWLGRPGYLDVAGIRELTSAGMMIGTHGMRHRSWRALDADGRHEELSVARSLIAKAAGMCVTFAACPFGAYDRRVIKALRRCGYTRVFTSDRRRAQPSAWIQPRYTITGYDTIQTVRDEILMPPPLRDRVRHAAAAKVKAWR